MFSAIQKLGAVAILVAFGTAARAADTFTVDPVHSSISFMIPHQEISYIHGRFNQFSGKFVIDRADPSKSSFLLVNQGRERGHEQPEAR